MILRCTSWKFQWHNGQIRKHMYVSEEWLRKRETFVLILDLDWLDSIWPSKAITNITFLYAMQKRKLCIDVPVQLFIPLQSRSQDISRPINASKSAINQTKCCCCRRKYSYSLNISAKKKCFSIPLGPCAYSHSHDGMEKMKYKTVIEIRNFFWGLCVHKIPVSEHPIFGVCVKVSPI